MFSQGQEIILTGKSQKGKNRIHFWGNVWIVARLDELPRRVGIVAKRDNPDDCILPNSFRWVDLPIDSDVEIAS
jgi:hypothetical protein